MTEKENLDPGKIPEMHPVEVYEKLRDSFEDIDSMKSYFEGIFNSYIHQNPDYYEWRKYKDTDWPNFFLMVDNRDEKEKELDDKYMGNTFFRVMSALESIKSAEDNPPEKEENSEKSPKIKAAVEYKAAMGELTGREHIQSSIEFDYFFKENPEIPMGKGIKELKEKTINSYLKAGDEIMNDNKLKAAETYHKGISMMDDDDQRQKEYGKIISEAYEELGDKRENYFNKAQGFNSIFLGKPSCYDVAIEVEQGIYGKVREELKKKSIEANKKLGKIYLKIREGLDVSYEEPNKKLGKIYLNEEEFELSPADAHKAEFKAEHAYEKALQLDPKDTEAMKGLAESWEKIGNKEKANEFYEKLKELERGPDSYNKQ